MYGQLIFDKGAKNTYWGDKSLFNKQCCEKWMHACMLNHFSCVQLSVTLWTVIHQAALSMGFSRQEYWSGLPCLPPGDLLGPGTEPTSLMSPVLTGGFLTTNATWEAQSYLYSMETGLWFPLPSGFLRETIQDALLVFRTCL